ncbi:MAG: DUF2285 domain-containing protein [Alphaproteobacteria bacterium]|nr:DUF2285 domain-containing protein [Alphaproteobacteria bacterium]
MHGGWSFPFPPELSASASPAIWRAHEAPSVVILETAADPPLANRPGSVLVRRSILNEVSNRNGRHLVLSDKHGRYRLLIREKGSLPNSGYLVAGDGYLEMRLAAIARLHGPPRRNSSAMDRQCLRPSKYQRHRLVLLLKILDRLSANEMRLPTLRTIATEVIYPQSQFGRALEWKTSSARRQTQRLVSEARYLMQAGYRDLLKGRTGRSKISTDQIHSLP